MRRKRVNQVKNSKEKKKENKEKEREIQYTNREDIEIEGLKLEELGFGFALAST
jgi:hypothetical protein